MNHKGSSGCTNPPGIPLGGIVPPGGKVPDTGDAAAASCPLIIDMDGNGVKTISINKNVFFDLDNNFFAENVGWVEKGDAFLVWDRDNNGVIDSGNELFGNHTLLRNGKKADNGFAALKELDDNNDQIFDEKDKAWFQLQLWFDHNQNGVSDEGELVKLSESGIKSIDLAYKNNNSTDENGNEHRQQSHVTWNDGRTSGITDVWFNTNTARSYYKEEVQISDDIKAMPNIIAFGNLLDLHAAIAKSPTLKYVIKEYMDANLAERDTLLNDLIYEWTGTSGVDPNSRGSSIDARKLAVLELITGRTFRQGSSLNPNSNAAKLLEAEFKKFADYTLAQLESKTVYKDIFTMNSFLINSETGELEFDWENLNSAITHFIKTRNFIEAKRVISIAKNLGIYNDEYLAVIDKNFANLAESDKTIAYFIKRNFVEGGIDDIKLVGTEDHDLILANSQDNILEAGNGDDTLIGGMGNDTLKGGFGADTYIFSKGHGQDVIYEYSDSANSKKDIDTLKFTDVNYAEVKFRRVDNDLMLFGYHDTDSVTVKSFYSHVDYQFDKLEFADRSITRDELIKAGLHLYGTDGNDDIKDHADWDSILEGGKGNDILRGGYGADTYIFSKGHGQDIVYEDTNNDNRARDIDTLKFTDVNYAEVKFRRVDNDLMLFGYHDTDSVTIKSFYNHVDYQFDKLDFADRSITRDELGKQGMALFGTDGDDNINDWGRNSVIDAGAGNDTVNGGNGDDTLIGGKGNDILRGGYGADTYIFSKGHGQDIVYEDTNNDNRARDIDTLKFTDVNYAEVKFRRVDNDLMLFGYHDTDSVTVKSFYSHVDYQFDKLEFADRSITRDELIKAGLHLYGTDGNDDIKDHADWDSILEGGKGNDILRGGYGADTYIFSKGHGQDIVYEDTNNDNRARDIDTLKFTDVNYAEVKFRRVDNDLMLFGYHDTDSVTIKSFYNHVDYQFDKLDFADRSITRDELGKQGMALFGTDGDDNINDWGRNSVIDAGAGNDTVNGGNGDDTLIGGKGNDILRGGYGADTYIFSKGHGQDIVYEDTNNDNRARDIDTLKFTDINLSELWFSRENNDLIIKSLLSEDKVTVQNWYSHQDHKIENIRLSNEQTLVSTQVEKMVESMAGFAQKHGGEISLVSPEEVKQYINSLTAAL
ncbi:calcium-binding protein [Actinobacillus pleuropneumoniae]